MRRQADTGDVDTYMTHSVNESQQACGPQSLRKKGKQEPAARRQYNAKKQDPKWIEPIGERYEEQRRNGIAGQVRGKDHARLGIVQSPRFAYERKGSDVAGRGKQDEK